MGDGIARRSKDWRLDQRGRLSCRMLSVARGVLGALLRRSSAPHHRHCAGPCLAVDLAGLPAGVVSSPSAGRIRRALGRTWQLVKLCEIMQVRCDCRITSSHDVSRSSTRSSNVDHSGRSIPVSFAGRALLRAQYRYAPATRRTMGLCGCSSRLPGKLLRMAALRAQASGRVTHCPRGPLTN